jgi:hypothetical protein
MTVKLYAFTCGTVTGEFAHLMEGGVVGEAHPKAMLARLDAACRGIGLDDRPTHLLRCREAVGNAFSGASASDNGARSG